MNIDFSERILVEDELFDIDQDDSFSVTISWIIALSITLLVFCGAVILGG